jgi:rubrerythrin
MSAASKEGKPRDTADPDMGQFLSHALAIEVDAWERYDALADQMIVHHNIDAALLFEQLGRYERKHAEEIEARLEGMKLAPIAPWDFAWAGAESPEAVDFTDVHYKMHPIHALQLALKAEHRAVEFFSRIAREASNDDVRRLAEEYAEEERGHVKLVQDSIAKLTLPPEDWEEDMDPPIPQ